MWINICLLPFCQNLVPRTSGVYDCLHGAQLLRKRKSLSLSNPASFMEQKIHYHGRKSPPLAHALRQIYQLHSFQPYFPKIYFNIIPI
jgi:hypothetical protein